MDFETLTIWHFLILALVAIIAAIIGYSFGKKATVTVDDSSELKKLIEKNTQLKLDLEACQKNVDSSNSIPEKATALSTLSNSKESANPFLFDAAAAKSIFGKTVKQDDLKIVEGIGPKIEGMFQESGIKTWKALANATVSDCQKVLDKGGKRYQIHDPASWPMQAKMCYEGKWEELSKWQHEHKHGKL